MDDPKTYHLLQSLPGIGKVLALVMLYEIQDIKRFPHDGNFLRWIHANLLMRTPARRGELLA